LEINRFKGGVIMKGTIYIAIRETVKSKWGVEVWNSVMKEMDISREPVVFPISDVDDNFIKKLIEAILKTLNISIEEFADVFGRYWVNEYANKIYGAFFKSAKNAKEFIYKVDDIHTFVTRTIENASPPRFKYEDEGKKVIVHYFSKRGLIDIAMGLAKAVGEFYNQPVKVKKLSDDRFEITFL